MPGYENGADRRVIVEDVGVDAALIGDDDGGTLVLRPGQSFQSAVTAVSKVLPNVHPDTVRRLVRSNLPTVPHLEDDPPVLTGAVPLHRVRVGTRRTVVGWLLVGAFVCGLGAASGTYLMLRDSPNVPAILAPVTDSDGDNDAAEQLSVFDAASFRAFASTVGWECVTAGQFAAHCIDVIHGGPVVVVAAVSDDAVSYTVEYGMERVSVRWFVSQSKAASWVDDLAPNQERSNMTLDGRLVAWGTDAELVKKIADAVPNAPTMDRLLG